MQFATTRAEFGEQNRAKANFDRIYLADDPREYFRVLYGLDYVIPDLAKGVLRELVFALEQTRGRPITILDVGCSYGVNGALLKYPLDIDRLAARYRELDFADLGAEEIIRLDRHYFNSWPSSPVKIIGFDASAPAVSYALRVGVIDAGVIADLEAGELKREDALKLRDVDLVISTGCIGYVGRKTFARLLEAFGPRKPWIASFVLRMFDYAELTDLFSEFDMQTEKLKGVSFVQRRFHSVEEFERVSERLRDLNIDAFGKEEEGLLHAEFFLSRPRAQAHDLTIDQLCSVSSGVNRRYGRRFRARRDQSVRFGR